MVYYRQMLHCRIIAYSVLRSIGMAQLCPSCSPPHHHNHKVICAGITIDVACQSTYVAMGPIAEFYLCHPAIALVYTKQQDIISLQLSKSPFPLAH